MARLIEEPTVFRRHQLSSVLPSVVVWLHISVSSCSLVGIRTRAASVSCFSSPIVGYVEAPDLVAVSDTAGAFIVGAHVGEYVCS